MSEPSCVNHICVISLTARGVRQMSHATDGILQIKLWPGITEAEQTYCTVHIKSQKIKNKINEK